MEFSKYFLNTSCIVCVTYEFALPDIHYQVYILTMRNESETSMIFTNIPHIVVLFSFCLVTQLALYSLWTTGTLHSEAVIPSCEVNSLHLCFIV